MATAAHAEPVLTAAADGWILRGDLLLPDAAGPVAVALLAHAAVASRKTMDRPPGAGLASALLGAGIAAMRFDLRGHGESGPAAREGASFSYDDFVKLDLPAVVAFARVRFPHLPVIVVGHSLGGHAALIASGLDPSAAPDAIVAIAANLWLPRFEPSPYRRALKRAALRGLYAVSLARGYFDPRLLGQRGDGIALPFIRQFVAFYESDELRSRDGVVDYMRAIRRARLPLLSITSEGDRLMAHPACVRRFMEVAEGCDVTHIVATRADLGAPAPGHMGLVTSAVSRPIWRRIAEWIAERARAR